jgi:hypothetical protein
MFELLHIYKGPRFMQTIVKLEKLVNDVIFWLYTTSNEQCRWKTSKMKGADVSSYFHAVRTAARYERTNERQTLNASMKLNWILAVSMYCTSTRALPDADSRFINLKWPKKKAYNSLVDEPLLDPP